MLMTEDPSETNLGSRHIPNEKTRLSEVAMKIRGVVMCWVVGLALVASAEAMAVASTIQVA